METKKQSHCWWFNSHNTPKCSPWLQSTLSELNDKTKTMLKLVEEDADSFAQRAEMYYKKRPELISMVEDFYRAHRSLAERYDQLKSDRAVRVRSPLRHSFSLPREEYEYVFDAVNSVKSFDSFTEVAYSSEEAAESEIDDPEEDEVDAQVDVVDKESEEAFAGGASYDELMKLRDELDQLREENEIQKNIIKQKDEEKDELVKWLSDNIRELREEMEEVRKEELGVVRKQTGEILVPSDEVTNLKDENLHEKKQVKKKADEVTEVMKKFEAEKTKNRYLEHALALKEQENAEITRESEETKSELAKLREEMRILNEKDEQKEEAIKHLKNAVAELEKKEEVVRQLKNALTERKMETKDLIRQMNGALAEKDNKKQEAIRHLKSTLAAKDRETEDAIRQLKDALTEKDEEKREAIRQLSVAMEIVREESKLLKKSLVNDSPKKSNADFQIFRGVNLGELFNFSSKCQSCVVPL